MYVVEVKPSARKANGAVGGLVNRDGIRHAFESRAAAEAWASGLSESGRRPVWIRSAHPTDRSDVDGYLVSRQRQLLDLDGAYDKRRLWLRGGASERETLASFES